MIWASEAGPPTTDQLQNMGTVSDSTYYVCDSSRQDRADEIIQQLYAPIINKMVEAGELNSWGWNSHVIAGRFPRLMTHSGTSHADLIAAVNKYNEAAAEANAAMANEFSQICNSHVDYLWNRILPKPAEGN